jgi:hypothetical protein
MILSSLATGAKPNIGANCWVLGPVRHGQSGVPWPQNLNLQVFVVSYFSSNDKKNCAVLWLALPSV